MNHNYLKVSNVSSLLNLAKSWKLLRTQQPWSHVGWRCAHCSDIRSVSLSRTTALPLSLWWINQCQNQSCRQHEREHQSSSKSECYCKKLLFLFTNTIFFHAHSSSKEHGNLTESVFQLKNHHQRPATVQRPSNDSPEAVQQRPQVWLIWDDFKGQCTNMRRAEHYQNKAYFILVMTKLK